MFLFVENVFVICQGRSTVCVQNTFSFEPFGQFDRPKKKKQFIDIV